MKIIYVPCKNNDEACKIAEHLVDKKFAFCVNIIPKIYSYYMWKGVLQENSEALMLIKTHKSFGIIEREVRRLHSYETPAIIEMKTGKINLDYLVHSRMH